MNVRLLSLALSLLLCVGRLAAGTESPSSIEQDYLNLLRVDLRAAKAEIVTNSLELTSEELSRFWPIYREYDLALVKLNEGRIVTLREFAANYASIDDGQARDLTRRSLEFQRKRLDLLERYFDRVAKAFNPATAARFLQIEHQLLMLVDVQLASELPLIPRQAIRARVN